MNLKNIEVYENSSIKEVLEAIDKGAIKFAIVIDKNSKQLLGTISDGDIRRALINGANLNDKIKNIYNKNPVVAKLGDTKERLIELCEINKIYQIPIIDENRRVVNIAVFDELIKPKMYTNPIVLMVGGLGKRLRPLTENIPKPMLRVGEKPILEIIIENFKKYGFYNFIFCVNYKAEIIQEHFKDGSEFGIKIEYIKEKKRLGTAGALSLIKNLDEPFFVMNGDILTNLNFKNLLKYHLQNGVDATMALREYEYEVPFGVVEFDKNLIRDIKEKPIYKFYINAGIYLLNPIVLDYIPKNRFFDMPDLFKILLKSNRKIQPFFIKDYWIDIGKIEEYNRAKNEIKGIFSV